MRNGIKRIDFSFRIYLFEKLHHLIRGTLLFGSSSIVHNIRYQLSVAAVAPTTDSAVVLPIPVIPIAVAP